MGRRLSRRGDQQACASSDLIAGVRRKLGTTEMRGVVTTRTKLDASSASMSVTDGVAPLLDTFRRREADLRRLLANRVGDVVDVDDLIQDLYLKLSTLKVTTPIIDAEAFCFRLAYNLAADRRRSSLRREQREQSWGRETASFVGLTPVQSSPSAEDVVAARQQLKALLDAVERLPPRSRQVFRLHKMDGMSYAAIAQSLHISVSAVEKSMMRALSSIVREVQR